MQVIMDTKSGCGCSCTYIISVCISQGHDLIFLLAPSNNYMSHKMFDGTQTEAPWLNWVKAKVVVGR